MRATMCNGETALNGIDGHMLEFIEDCRREYPGLLEQPHRLRYVDLFGRYTTTTFRFLIL